MHLPRLDDSSVSYDLQLPSEIPLIVEIGINHNGDLELAKRMISLAKQAGAWAVKFQKRSVELVYSREELDSQRDSPWGSTFRQQKEGLEFSQADYEAIHEYCNDLGILWSASAWDIPSLEFLDYFDLSFHKVASAMTTNKTFLKQVASRGKLTFVSTGMCDWEDIASAVDIFESETCPIVLMHSVSTYPAKDSILNLRQIGSLRSRFGKPVGYSGHEASVLPSIVAATLGAVTIERHFTLDRAMYGSDQESSLEPDDLRALAEGLRRIPELYGNPEKKLLEEEKAVAKKLRYWDSR